MLEVNALAGPVCPVETDPPDPDCEPRPVGLALVIVSPGDGRDILVADGLTDAGGAVSFVLSPGDYIVTGGDVEGLFGRPDPLTIVVTEGVTSSVTIVYDTGIR